MTRVTEEQSQNYLNNYKKIKEAAEEAGHNEYQAEFMAEFGLLNLIAADFDDEDY